MHALSEPKEMAKVVGECIKNQWPDDTRRCVADARDEPDLMACLMRMAETTKKTIGRPSPGDAAEAKQGDPDTHLRVTGLEPPKGDADGGTYVRIRGNRFIADGARNAKVYFGSRQGTVVRFASDDELIVEAPGGRANETVDVLVIFEPGGELKLPRAFTFVDSTGRGSN
ncbi:MAG TPA: IPT/TIG domain-containing protein [Kofleriaceae bacterium]